MDIFSRELNRFVLETISYYDLTKDIEAVYQAFLLGLFLGLHDYEVISNRETGYGRVDIMLIPHDKSKHGFIMELKSIDEYSKEKTVEESLQSALQQIEDKKYDTELKKRGINNIIKLAITFDGKRVFVKTP